MERIFHGNPSGVDPVCSAHRKLILYAKSTRANPGKSREIVSRRPIKVLVALVGKRGSTAEAIAGLHRRMSQWGPRYKRLLSAIGMLADEGVKAIQSGDLGALGDAMNVNQGLLNALQLSSPPIEDMVDRLRREGALGSKLTGAGGRGGAVIGLFLEPETAVARLSREGIPCFGSQIAGPLAL
jgi:mevalonate kinase